MLTFARQFIQGIDNRFDNYGSTVYLISELVPSVLVERNLKVKNAIEQYQGDLQKPICAKEELFRWKRRWESV